MEKDELLTFLKHKTGLYLNLPGCLRKFDSMASWFLRAEDAAGRAQVIARAKEDANKETDEAVRAKAKKYVKIMQMIDVKGEEALEAEKERVERLIKEENMSEGKREDMLGTLNVIKSFERLRDPRERREDDKKEIEEARLKAEGEGDKDEL